MPLSRLFLTHGLLAAFLAGVAACDRAPAVKKTAEASAAVDAAPATGQTSVAPVVDGATEAQEEAVSAPAPARPEPADKSAPAEFSFLMVAKEQAPISTKVVRWDVEDGFSGNTPGPEGPRFGDRKITDETLAKEVATHGWNRQRLAQQVDQFVLHFDGCCTSRQCAHVLEDRGLSIHFMLDADGTLYQALDLTARAWHATIANDRSVGVEIANPGAPAEAKAPEFLARFYKKTADGWPMLCPPAGPDIAWPIEFLPRPARPDLVIGPIHKEKLAQFDYTPQQYEALARLLAALHRQFPKIQLDCPREVDGTPMARQLTAEEFAKFQGVLGHYHVQRNKVDPGPAMQWDWLIKRAKEVAEADAKGVEAPPAAPLAP